MNDSMPGRKCPQNTKAEMDATLSKAGGSVQPNKHQTPEQMTPGRTMGSKDASGIPAGKGGNKE